MLTATYVLYCIGIICFNIPVQNSFKGGSGATAGAFGGATDDASDPELWWYFTTEKQIKYVCSYTSTMLHLTLGPLLPASILKEPTAQKENYIVTSCKAKEG